MHVCTRIHRSPVTAGNIECIAAEVPSPTNQRPPYDPPTTRSPPAPPYPMKAKAQKQQDLRDAALAIADEDSRGISKGLSKFEKSFKLEFNTRLKEETEKRMFASESKKEAPQDMFASESKKEPTKHKEIKIREFKKSPTIVEDFETSKHSSKSDSTSVDKVGVDHSMDPSDDQFVFM